MQLPEVLRFDIYRIIFDFMRKWWIPIILLTGMNKNKRIINIGYPNKVLL